MVADEFGQARDDETSRDGEPAAEIVPERYAEFGASLGDAEEGVTAVTSGIASRAAADLAPGHLAANVVLGAVGVEWDLRPIERHQQFGFVGVETREQPVEGSEARPALEDSVEAGS